MPQSYLVRNQQNRQDFLQGLQLAQHVLQLQHQDEELVKRQKFSEQKQDERYQLMLRNSYAEHALQYAHEADKIKSQNAIQWRENYWNKSTTGYLQTLTDQENQVKDYLKPENAWKVTPQTLQQARSLLREINDRRTAIAQSTPTDFNEFRDPTPLLAPLRTPFNPQESEEAKNARYSKEGLTAAQIAHVKAQTNKIENGTTGDITKIANKNRLKFIDAVRGVYALGPSQNNKTGNLAPKLDAFGQPVTDKSLQTAKSAWAKTSQPFLENLQNPQLVGSDVSQLFQHTAPQFNNLATFDDFHNWLNYLSKQDYSGEGGAEARKAAQKLHMLTTGISDPTISSGSEETGETTPDNEEEEDQ